MSTRGRSQLSVSGKKQMQRRKKSFLLVTKRCGSVIGDYMIIQTAMVIGGVLQEDCYLAFQKCLNSAFQKCLKNRDQTWC